jgi:hypothetical protein
MRALDAKAACFYPSNSGPQRGGPVRLNNCLMLDLLGTEQHVFGRHRSGDRAATAPRRLKSRAMPTLSAPTRFLDG